MLGKILLIHKSYITHLPPTHTTHTHTHTHTSHHHHYNNTNNNRRRMGTSLGFGIQLIRLGLGDRIGMDHYYSLAHDKWLWLVWSPVSTLFHLLCFHLLFYMPPPPPATTQNGLSSFLLLITTMIHSLPLAHPRHSIHFYHRSFSPIQCFWNPSISCCKRLS